METGAGKVWRARGRGAPGIRASWPLAPEARYPLSGEQSKRQKFDPFGVPGGEGSDVVSWSALWRREGGGDATVTDARSGFYPSSGEEAEEMSLCHLFG